MHLPSSSLLQSWDFKQDMAQSSSSAKMYDHGVTMWWLYCLTIKTYISSLVCMTRFWNNLHHLCLKWRLESQIIKKSGRFSKNAINMIYVFDRSPFVLELTNKFVHIRHVVTSFKTFNIHRHNLNVASSRLLLFRHRCILRKDSTRLKLQA